MRQIKNTFKFENGWLLSEIRLGGVFLWGQEKLSDGSQTEGCRHDHVGTEYQE